MINPEQLRNANAGHRFCLVSAVKLNFNSAHYWHFNILKHCPMSRETQID
jgi:hypothetical protein